ncbi:MAG TPA: exopolysaccharide biosynthesis protein [Longimicrobium sp.]|uniref:exopolysaccharide biosynthesis protein n=1 Tax=Longimicrobium sp. TaxID=2029185 RepID=UPI002ED81FA6
MDSERPEPPRPRGTGALLRHALMEMERAYETAGRATLRDLLRPLGTRQTALGAALLALPFLSPVSLGPITTPASLLIALLGVRMLRRRDDAPVPERLLRVQVPRSVHTVMVAMLQRVSHWADRGRGARRSPWVRGTAGRRLCGAGVLAGALLLAVPVPLLPLTNTLPAAGIILFVLGWTNQDLRLTRYGMGALAGSLLLFATLGAAAATAGWAAVQALLPG